MFRKSLFLLLALASLPLASEAHEGHGLFHGNEPAHYLSSPEHAIPLALAAVAAFLLIVYRREARAGKRG